MHENEFRVREDILFVRSLLGITQKELGKELGVARATVNRWENGDTSIPPQKTEAFYALAFENGVELNKIKEQFYTEDITDGKKLLFHGAKNCIEGGVRHDASRANNDFGTGFYMGESFRQAGLFVSNFERSCVYILSFDPKDLIYAKYSVDTEWMLSIAAFRGRLNGLLGKKEIEKIKGRALKADYIIAPIADNRMYQIIDTFIDGEITDEQCRHALSATNLGMQYVARTSRAVSAIKIEERCYVCIPEKKRFVSDRQDDLRVSENKVRGARIKYRGKGKYIDELICEII